jgi:hypothetical protein
LLDAANTMNAAEAMASLLVAIGIPDLPFLKYFSACALLSC